MSDWRHNLSVAELALAQRTRPSVVRITTERGGRQGTGAGVMVAPGVIVTCWHVVSAATAIRVTAGRERRDASLLATRASVDLVLLHTALRVPVMAIAAAAHADMRGVAIGAPGGADNVTTRTLVLSVGETVSTELGRLDDMVMFMGTVAPGNSGGALTDHHGNLIGIVTARSPLGQGGFAAPVTAVRQLLDEVGVEGAPAARDTLSSMRREFWQRARV